MNFIDLIKLSIGAVSGHRMRSFLTALGIAVGIAAVVLLTSLGQGVHTYVLAEFTQFGTNLIAVQPGKATTHGIPGAMINTVRPLSIDDAEALSRLPNVLKSLPFVMGNAQVEFEGNSRRVYIYGVGADLPEVWQIPVSIGRFLPDENPRLARPFAVLGSRARAELFGTENPLGKRIRIGGERYRIIGAMESKGQMLGFDLDDVVYLPVSRVMSMFNRESLIEVDILFDAGADPDSVAEKIKRLMISRHGCEDFTLITQKQMIDSLGNILNVLTLAVSALGGISLLVGGVGILTIMTIAVTERTSEIGLLRALGATQRQVLFLFLSEASALSGIGGIAGLIIGFGGAILLDLLVPALPVHTPFTYVILAEILAVCIGLVSGILPALRAARLDPVEALRAE